MRWYIVCVLFIVAVFGFFVGYAVSSLLLSTVSDTMTNEADKLSTESRTRFLDDVSVINIGFGVICSIGLTMMVMVFVLDAFSDEPENYWRE